MSILDRPKALVLYSGGKDSFLTACDMIAKFGMDVVLFSCNNGALVAESNLKHGVHRLQDNFGDDHVTFAGVYGITSIIQRLNSWWVNSPIIEIAKRYPNVTECQVRCMNCQTAMWVAAMAYAKAKDIRMIAAGYKAIDGFCTGISNYISALTALAEELKLSLMFPRWECENAFTRDTTMISYGFQPTVLEPKCMLGTPATLLNTETKRDLMLYFKDELLYIIEESIPYYTSIFQKIKLSEQAYLGYVYPLDS